MITDETIERIWHCKREIEAGEKLLSNMAEEQERMAEWGDREKAKTEPTLKDAFGRTRHLQLGVPSGSNGHRLYDVSPLLAASIIRAHIAKKQASLVEANEQARIELSRIEFSSSGDSAV